MARDKAAAPPQHKRGRSRTGTGGTPAGKRSGAGPGHRRADPAGQGHGRREQERREIAGLEVRWVAVRLISAVVLDRNALDDAIAKAFTGPPGNALSPRDRGLARLIAATALRRKGEIEAVLSRFIERPLPESRGRLTPILLAAAAQLLFLETPPHAVLNIAVEQCRRDRGARRFDKLANAVLRRVSEQGKQLLAEAGGERLDIPPWMWARWAARYGEAAALEIARASLREAALDLTARADAAAWAERLGGVLLPTGTIRLPEHGRIEELAGFGEGAWWVQDAAAALPARLLGNVAGMEVADLCAAPGGKTAQLAAAGARVTAIDASEARLARVSENLRRLGLEAQVVCADATAWSPGRLFDCVLLDAPCTATGTIRRHPDILHLKRPGDVGQLAALQARLLGNAAALVRPGGLLVYCTCSLEPEEGETQVAALLAAGGSLARVPIRQGEAAIPAEWLTPAGDLRTLPCHLPSAEPRLAGLDGFYAARLRRTV